MTLWVDKYRPKELTKLDYHQEQGGYLKNLAQRSDFPHLMFYGPSGAGKKTRIMCLLRELYGNGVERLRNETMNFTTPSNRTIDIMTIGSNYHMEVNPSDAGIYDRTVIVDLIKRVAQTHQLDQNGQRNFKVIVLSEVDNLTKEAQHALRRTMEKYISNCRIILCCNSTSRVIPAIRSRCLGVRVAAPTIEDIVKVINYVCKKEGLTIPIELAERIANKSERNLRRAILMLESCKVQKYPFTGNQEVIPLDWQVFLEGTAAQILFEQTPEQLGKVRERLYELLSQGVPSDVIFKGLVENLVKNCDILIKAKTVELAAFYEHRMQHGSKHIFHLEAFVANFIVVYKKFLTNSAFNDEF